MGLPQPGIFAVGNRTHHHLEFDCQGEPAEVLAAIQRIREAATTVAGVNVVVGFGARQWASMSIDAPTDLAAFATIEGPDGFTIPATQHDLWLWLHASGPDAVFNVARIAAVELADLATVAFEQPCFTYQASQDLTGFEDGTENPPLDEAIESATIAGDGGSIVLLQKWVHDLDGFEALELSDREQVIGRTLAGSVELDEENMVPGSHVSRVVIEDDAGEELEVFRRSTTFGGVTEHGLMFLAFSADRVRLERMLQRMAGADDGVRDRLTEFSTPVRSAWYYAPPLERLRVTTA
ncbi:MAG: Dyp-type peroxidase [Acidimicrobiales bacterium]|nr:Dyp-type peroxidase [Acidimicrobiales bacterium]